MVGWIFGQKKLWVQQILGENRFRPDIFGPKKNKEALKNEDNLKNEDDLKNKYDINKHKICAKVRKITQSQDFLKKF